MTLLYCTVIIMWMLLYVPNEIYSENDAVCEEDITYSCSQLKSFYMKPTSDGFEPAIIPSCNIGEVVS
jgi:hypothetical protein